MCILSGRYSLARRSDAKTSIDVLWSSNNRAVILIKSSSWVSLENHICHISDSICILNLDPIRITLLDFFKINAVCKCYGAAFLSLCHCSIGSDAFIAWTEFHSIGLITIF